MCRQSRCRHRQRRTLPQPRAGKSPWWPRAWVRKYRTSNSMLHMSYQKIRKSRRVQRVAVRREKNRAQRVKVRTSPGSPNTWSPNVVFVTQFLCVFARACCQPSSGRDGEGAEVAGQVESHSARAHGPRRAHPPCGNAAQTTNTSTAWISGFEI